MQSNSALELVDHEPEQRTFLADVLESLRRSPKQLPCKYFYDEAGSAWFDRICDLPEYYPTRTERSIMEDDAAAMAEALGERCLLVEYGSGSSIKTRLLLDHLAKPAAYVPLDISREHLMASATRLSDRYPDLEVLPVCADFTRDYTLPDPTRPESHRVVYFPGSTIGNFTRERAVSLLAHMAEVCAPDGGCLVGVDLKKDPELLVRAYDDAAGVTAAFNKNLLVRINRELGADFDLEQFAHEARWNEAESCIEMHLVSRREATVQLGGELLSFAEDESICTEHSHKYSLPDFEKMAEGAGLRVAEVWTDPKQWFSVQLLRVA